MTDQTSVVQAQQASAKAAAVEQAKPETKTTAKRYYMPFNGSRIVLPTGKTLVFAGGCLETDIQEEIDYIEKAIKAGAAISRTPMGIVKSDAQPMREIGPSAKGRGATTSQTIAALAAESSAGHK